MVNEYYEIDFKDPTEIDFEDLDFSFKIKFYIPNKAHLHRKRFSNKALGELLLDFGFNLGPNRDPEKIFTRIPKQFQEAFKRGLQIT